MNELSNPAIFFNVADISNAIFVLTADPMKVLFINYEHFSLKLVVFSVDQK